MTMREAVKLWGISEGSIQRAILDDKIPGATKVPGPTPSRRTYWYIPDDAAKPALKDRATAPTTRGRAPTEATLDKLMTVIARVCNEYQTAQQGSLWAQLVEQPNIGVSMNIKGNKI
jgi:hypothetical protein